MRYLYKKFQAFSGIFYIDIYPFFLYIIPAMEAGIAQLVEYKLPKLGVASSNLVARSNHFWEPIWVDKM
jgi:hypothetical protein